MRLEQKVEWHHEYIDVVNAVDRSELCPEKRLLVSILIGALQESVLSVGHPKSVTYHRNRCIRHAAHRWLRDDTNNEPWSILWVLEHLTDDVTGMYRKILKSAQDVDRVASYSVKRKRQRVRPSV